MKERELKIREAYRGDSSRKKVLVTGHTGFKGAWLLGMLQELDCDVIGFSLDPKPQDLYHQVPHFHPKVDIRADLKDRDQLRSILHEFQPDVIFHLAAQSLIYEGIKDPATTYETNILGLVYLLEALRNLSHSGVVVVTSDKCYEPSDEVHTETSRLGGNEPYSVSKAAIEMIVHAYRQDHSFDHSIATARSGNVIGSGDLAEHRLIPDWVRSQKEQQVFSLRKPTAYRPFQHVLEPLMGYLILGQHLQNREMAEAWNFGPQKSLQVQDIIDLCEQYQHQNQQIVSPSTSSFLEQNHLHIDSSKAKRTFAWQNKLTPEQMIAWTLEGYFCSKTSKIEDICRRQIRDYWKMYFSE